MSDINMVWEDEFGNDFITTGIHYASEEPSPGPPVLAQGLKGQWFVVSAKLIWKNTVNFYNIKKWCYLPEGKV